MKLEIGVTGFSFYHSYNNHQISALTCISSITTIRACVCVHMCVYVCVCVCVCSQAVHGQVEISTNSKGKYSKKED